MAFNVKKRGKLTYYYNGDNPVLSALVTEEQADGDPKIYFSGLTGGYSKNSLRWSPKKKFHWSFNRGNIGFAKLGFVTRSNKSILLKFMLLDVNPNHPIHWWIHWGMPRSWNVCEKPMPKLIVPFLVIIYPTMVCLHVLPYTWSMCPIRLPLMSFTARHSIKKHCNKHTKKPPQRSMRWLFILYVSL